MYRDVLFISDLPRYVIPAGIRILQANDYNTSPGHDWLPEQPDFSSFQVSSNPRSASRSRSSSSHRSHTLISQHDSFIGVRPDPEGFDSHSPHHYRDRAPVQNIHMGGHTSAIGSNGGMSPLTFRGSGSVPGGAAGGSVLGGRSVMGGAPPVPLDILSISTTITPAPSFVPLAQPDTSSAISVLGDSASDPTPPAPSPPVATPALVIIKDKASDLGIKIKDVTDKEMGTSTFWRRRTDGWTD